MSRLTEINGAFHDSKVCVCVYKGSSFSFLISRQVNELLHMCSINNQTKFLKLVFYLHHFSEVSSASITSPPLLYNNHHFVQISKMKYINKIMIILRLHNITLFFPNIKNNIQCIIHTYSKQKAIANILYTYTCMYIHICTHVHTYKNIYIYLYIHTYFAFGKNGLLQAHVYTISVIITKF